MGYSSVQVRVKKFRTKKESQVGPSLTLENKSIANLKDYVDSKFQKWFKISCDYEEKHIICGSKIHLDQV